MSFHRSHITSKLDGRAWAKTATTVAGHKFPSRAADTTRLTNLEEAVVSLSEGIRKIAIELERIDRKD
jgi:hypothetical protein